MPSAYVLINTEIGTERTVLKYMRSIPGVKESYIIYGAYDLICKIEENDMTNLQNTITGKIRKINQVLNTSTMFIP